MVEYVISLQRIRGIAYLASSSWTGVRVAILKADGVAGHLTHKEKGRDAVGEVERRRDREGERERDGRAEVGEGSLAVRVGHFEWACLRDKCHFHSLMRGWAGLEQLYRRLCHG